MKTKMDRTTLRALKASIRHWERMVKNPFSEAPISNNCHLCKLFAFGVTATCAGCPVAAKTEEIGCGGTPYEKAYDAWCELENDSDQKLMQKWRKAAGKELRFFRSLLPKSKP